MGEEYNPDLLTMRDKDQRENVSLRLHILNILNIDSAQSQVGRLCQRREVS